MVFWVREIQLQPTLENKVDSILEEHRSLITLMRRYFAMLRPDRVKRLKRQPQGDHVDMDAVVEALVERRQGIGNAENLYIWRDKRNRDVAVAFLMDCSGSTNEEISAGKTILDQEKEAVIIMSEALEMLGDNFAVYSFSSDGRLQVDFQVVKEFNEVYDDTVRQRFGSLKSMEMTRLAATVRHAVEKMKKVKAAVKLLFILSDGRPYDMDYRAREQEEKSIGQWLRQDEMLYPQEDTRMALWEAKSSGITPFCLTVDKQAKQYMDKIFGQVGYVLINDVAMLPAKLPEIYRRLTT
ncbi:MAG: VWA domain-containing protein [Candidatus Contubernalis sp.]|nr:VWA domain-containing protein [Candidatus Contubernalis sp.]